MVDDDLTSVKCFFVPSESNSFKLIIKKESENLLRMDKLWMFRI